MAKFFVGQKVRIVGAKNFVHLNGREATIVAPGTICNPNYHGNHWVLDIDAYLPKRGLFGLLIYDWEEDQLAPAYDGNEKVSWESMKELWTPHEEKAIV